jgi:DNA-binding NtrC family response regulator
VPLILVVDDQEHMCWVLHKVLSEAGYAVQTARSGNEALRICADGGMVAAIIDYRLPDMNGIELFQQANSTGRTMVGILITSYGSPKLREEALAAGFLTYFDKPLSHKKLLECLDGVVAPKTLL